MIEIKNLSKKFTTNDGVVNALNDVSITVNDGDIFGIIGMSGAGKSTLVRCINMLEKPTEGTVVIDGQDLTSLTAKELREVRRNVTMIFQGFNLLMQRTCLKNIMFPLELIHTPKNEAKKKALELLETVGLADKANAYPSQLSGGQQQRIAIARALATNPKVLLCDEATSALDPKTTHQILELIRDINAKLGITVIIITHQMSVVEDVCTKVAILDGGKVAEQGLVTEVFSAPKTEAARRLVFSNTNQDENDKPEPFDGKKIRVIFNGASAVSDPLIAKMAVDTGVLASILSAQTKSAGGKVFGTMILGIVGGDNEAKRAVEYITAIDGVTAEEV